MAPSEFTKALKSTNEIELTVTGRVSGRAISHPVWFVQDGKTLSLLPVTGSDSDWYKNVLKTPTICLTAKGTTWTAKATQGCRQGIQHRREIPRQVRSR